MSNKILVRHGGGLRTCRTGRQTPSGGGSMPERLKGADCKSAGDGLRWFESSSTHSILGKVAEWFNASVLKTDVASTLPGVRIPPFPRAAR